MFNIGNLYQATGFSQMPAFESSISLLAIVVAVAYLLGSIPFGLIVSKAFGFGDVRKIGSGNIGATNVLRTGSKSAALATLLLDAGKGLVAVLLARNFVGEDAAQLAGLAAFLGHLYPVWLGFRGGKGVATFLGTLIALAPNVGLFALVGWLFAFFVFRISSLAALVSSAATTAIAYIIGYGEFFTLLLVMTVFLFWKHRENIRRLLAGNEPTVGWSKK